MEDVNDGGVHLYGIVLLFQGHSMGDLDVGLVVDVGGPV